MRYHRCFYTESADREREQFNVIDKVGRKTNVFLWIRSQSEQNSKHQGLEITFQSLQ